MVNIELEKLYKRQVLPYLTDEDITIIYMYTCKYYKVINKYVRDLHNGTVSHNDNLDNYVNKLCRIINMSKLPFNLSVYRGMNKNYISNYNDGDIYKTDSFVSTSLSYSIARSFSDRRKENGIVIKIDLEKGTNFLWLGNTAMSMEKELLLPFDEEYIVFDDKKDGDTNVCAYKLTKKISHI